MKNELKKTCIIIAVIALFFVVCSFFWVNWMQSVSLSLGVNLLVSIIIIRFVNLKIEEQSKAIANEEERMNEHRKILRSNKVIDCILQIYISEFNQLTIPIDKRIVDSFLPPPDGSNFNESFTVNDLCDMFQPNLTIYGERSNCILETYAFFENKLVSAFETMLTNCTFSYYPEVEATIINIINTSYQPTAIESLSFYRKASKDLFSTIREMIQEYNGNPLEDIKNDKYKSNVFLDVLILYFHLNKMKSWIEQYRIEIQKLL